MAFNWKKLEENWQKAWESAKIFEADPDPTRKKLFATFPFPYMNGPLHVGHAFTATRLDAYVRFKRMQGYNVLFPWSWHWTGEPIVGAALRVKLGDKKEINALKAIDKVSDENLKKFADPVYMAQYYTRENKQTVKRAGLSVDWRREFHTTSLNPGFSKFIEWQYMRLLEKGFIAKGTHPVVWCVHCESPTGDHDRLEGEGVSPEEYVLMKFKFGDTFLPAATLRPETIYGVTNLWVNPETEYVEAMVDGEKWIISPPAAEKLKQQLKTVQEVRRLFGKELVGKKCVDLVAGRELLILPAWFVDPESGTGVVYSVPAHAPDDWLGLRDLQTKPELLAKFEIAPELVKAIKPISLIRVEGFGEYPAIELVNRMGIKDQHDLIKSAEATQTIYKKEFHTGVLKENCGKYAGKKVYEVKQQLINDFREAKIVDIMYDLPQRVICRCTTPCIVKILKDQWFLKYSDEGWKEKTREAVEKAYVTPSTARTWFIDIINWLKEKACARKTGLGTPLPWSPEWIVETLSDSTIYMAYYPISKFVNAQKIKPEQLTPEIFDYIFHGKGEPENLARKVGIDPSILKTLNTEFKYWYPVDIRTSAKELLPNHLTFFLFHHTALFPPEHWPRGIDVNGLLTIEGEKMSKSKGNFVTLRDAIETYGADPARCALVLGAEEMNDPDWRAGNVRDVKSKLESFYELSQQIINMKGEEKVSSLEKWLVSVLQRRIQKITESLEQRKTRTAAETAFFEIWNDLRWYLRRAEEPNCTVLIESLNIWTRLMAPFAPYISEEIWKNLKQRGFVSNAPWPAYEETKIDVNALEYEELVKAVLDDTLSIIKAIGLTPKKLCYYAAAEWKWRAYMKALNLAEKGTLNTGNLIKGLVGEPDLKQLAKEIPKYAQKIVETVNKLSPEERKRRLSVGTINELELLCEAAPFFKREFNVPVEIFSETDTSRHDPKNRAQLSEPYRPAIYIE